MALSLKHVPSARGSRWIGDAFRLFGRKPLAFMMLFAVFLLSALVVSLVPFLGGLVQMMALPLLSLGFMVAGQSVLLGGAAHPRHFLEPLRGDPSRRRSLLILCAVYGVLAVLILVLADQISANAWGRLQALMAKSQTAQTGPAARAVQGEIDALLSEPGVTSAALLTVLLGVALTVPFWHAPALVHWGGQGWGQALFSSTLALWRSKGAFLVYGLGWLAVVLVFGISTALIFNLLGLGQLTGVLAIPAGLVFSAVFYLSVLFSFNDSFGIAATPPDAVGEDPPLNPPV